MDLVFCINKNSFPSTDKESGVRLFSDAIQGALQLTGNDGERVQFYYDSHNESLLDLLIAPEFSYDDFIKSSDDVDIQTFLYEVEDKSPAIDNLSEDQFDELTSCIFYISDQVEDEFNDVYGLTWVIDGYLLSLATHERWSKSEIKINKTEPDGQYNEDCLYLKNISTFDHGVEHNSDGRASSLEAIVHPNLISENFMSWYGQQINENKKIINNKIILAVKKDFQGGMPLFDTLENGEGIREIRMSAYAGGAIRLLFKKMKNSQHVFLVAFIKHSNNEGYDRHIPLAKNIYKEMNA